MANRYDAAEGALRELMEPHSREVMFDGFLYRNIYLSDPHLFQPRPKSLVEIERLMKGLTQSDVPQDEQWWAELKAAVLRLYTGEVLLQAGVVTKHQLETGDFEAG